MIKHSIFEEEIQTAIDEVEVLFFQDDYFTRQCDWCRYLLFECRDLSRAEQVIRLGINYAKSCGLPGDMLPLIYIARMLPLALEYFKQEGLTEEETAASLQDIGIWVRVYRKYHNGAIGLERYGWVLRSVMGAVRRLGSLQFEEITYGFCGVVLQNLKHKEYLALVQDGTVVDQDGYLYGTNGRRGTEKFIATLKFCDGWAEGYGIDLEKGIVRTSQLIRLNMAEWKIVLAPGERAVAIHIPEGTDLSPDKINLSLMRAAEHYGGTEHTKNKLFICDSWLLDPHLVQLVSRSSRICSFMERFYKLPVFAETPQIFERVMGFDFREDGLARMDCETSLQKALRSYLMDGNEVFTTAGFMVY